MDSSEFAFQEAARQCFKKLIMAGHPQLLEPVMAVEVTAPEDYLGAVTGSICQRRGRIEQMNDKGGVKVVSALVPLSEMFGYSNTIRTLTQNEARLYDLRTLRSCTVIITEQIIEKRRAANKIR